MKNKRLHSQYVIYLTPKEHGDVCSYVKLLSVPLKLLLVEMIMTNPALI